MSFANPWALWGCLAALIPLLVHLFDRRRPRPHPFPAISFVLRSQKRTASRLKLKRLLLYALRTLILLAIPLALARPEFDRDAKAAASRKGPAATAIVLDASLSMRWQDGKSLYERARGEAREALAELTPEEPATVLVCGPNPTPPPAAAFDRRALRALIDDAEVPSYGEGDLHRCLELAARALEDSPLAARRLVLVSDMAQHGFRLEAPPPVVGDGKGGQVKPEVVLRQVGPERLPNAALVDLQVEPALQVGPRAFQFTFTVRNFGEAPLTDVEAALVVDGRTLAKGFLEVPAGGTARKTLTHRFEKGGTVAGEVVVEADALAEDNRRPFVLHVPEELKLLVVNGSPAAQRYRDETFFLEPALTAPGSPVHATFRDAEAGLREDFQGYDVLYLVNVAAPEGEVAGRLRRFVEQGGGLFISVGDRVEPAPYNEQLGALLPRPLRDVRTAAEREAPDAEARAGRLSRVETAHPLFSPFTGEAGEGLQSARFYRYMLLEAQAGGAEREGGQVLATFQDGAPALAVATRGEGRVALFTSTVDRDWGDFAIRTSFLPLMQRMAAWLAGALEEREVLQVQVGSSLPLRPPEGQRLAEVAGPQREVPVRAREDGTVEVGPLLVPGTYQVKSAQGEVLPALSFATVLGAGESDLTRVAPETLEAYFGKETVTTSPTEGARPEVPLWTWLIAAAALAFFGEGLLLRK